jgi:hypothetical protein
VKSTGGTGIFHASATGRHAVRARGGVHIPRRDGLGNEIGGDLIEVRGRVVHLDRGYDSGTTRDLLGFTPHIAVKGQPAP